MADSWVVVGLDNGGNKNNATVLDAAGEYLVSQLFERPSRVTEGPEVAVQALVESFDDILQRTAIARDRVRAVGLDTPGPASAEGVISSRGSTNFAHPGWRNFDFRGSLETRLGLPVVYNNDGNAAALYAHYQLFGPAAPRRSSISAIVGTGLGGGVIEKGQVVKGAAGFAGNGTQGEPGKPRALVAIWDVHGRWTPGPFDLSALYARGTIGDTARLNAPLVGQPTLIPAAFDGWYAQAAWRAWSSGDLGLAPFVRYERFDTGREYADLGPGLTPAALPAQGVITAGASFTLAGGGVVLKADVQSFQEDHQRDRLDLGLGWSF